MLKWNLSQSHTTYQQERFELLVLLEGSTRQPYVDAVGDPTIGIGFNLVYNLEPVLRALVGATSFSATLLDRLEAEINKDYGPSDNALLAANLDRVMARWHDQQDSAVPSHFRFDNDAQISRALSAMAPSYDTMIDSWIAAIPESDERAALFSMTWNAPSLLGPKLKFAVEHGNRAEAWYEIRYNSNGHGIEGIANRRYVEAETFGLNDREGFSTYGEAVKIGQMLAYHHRDLLAYEDRYDPVEAGLVKGVDGIADITEEIAPAIRTMLRIFELSTKTPVEELLVASAARRNISGDGTDSDTSRNDNDLIVGSAQANSLSGGAGRDVLIGLAGADLLKGGAGADLFLFSARKDSSTGAFDTIADFNASVDRMDFSALDATEDHLTFLETRNASFSGDHSEIRWFWSGQKTILQLDLDADGAADMKLVLSGRQNLDASDFLL